MWKCPGATDHLNLAESIACAVFPSSFAHPGPIRAAQIGLGLISVLRVDETAVQQFYAELAPISQTMSPQCPMGPGLAGDRVLGLLTHTMRNFDRAASHYEAALTFCRKAGYRPELAWTCCDYADTLLERNGPGDRAKARSMLDKSLDVATDLGMRPLMERVRSRLHRVLPSSGPVPTYPDGLTRREVEVLNLIAQGKSNRAIGQDLVISEGTVRRHVNNIYDKIGVTNRAQATRYALEQELVAS